MTSPAPRPGVLPRTGAEDLVDALLYSVSHDLRSPLLALSLSGQLLRESIGSEATERTTPLLDGMQAAAADLERMLQALTVLSRARRRPLHVRPVALDALLAGGEVRGAIDGMDVEVDVDLLREFLDWCDAPLQLEQVPGGVRLVVAPPALPEYEGTPLHALTRSLQRYSGTPLERLAVFEVAFARGGVALVSEDGRVLLDLPRAGAASG
ncbi:MAG: hypothetical protein GEU80_12660 [Dehalococcoidia bacterium]|nr:hypothetical protein [Dehalococcoidia bacterium]